MAEGAAREPAAASSALERVKLGFKGLRPFLQLNAAAPGEADGAVQAPAAGAAAGMETAATNSWASWAERAKKMVAEKVAYDAVPQAEGGSPMGEDGDLEKGEAPQWALWAKAAAGRVRQQVTATAEEARQNLEKAAERAKSVEWGEQAKGWHSEVTKGFSRVADGATQATVAISEKGKAAQQLAKDIGGKGQQKLAEAKALGAVKAREAKEKAAAAAGAAKDKLAQAGQSISGLAALSMSPAKLAQFGGVFLLGIFLISMSFSFLPILVISPQKFALLFAFGSMTLLSSFAILKGPQAFVGGLLQREKLPFSVAYAVGLVGTLVATILMRSYLLTAFFGLMQAVALLYFVASYVPGGKAALNFLGRMCSRLARATVCRRMI